MNEPDPVKTEAAVEAIDIEAIAKNIDAMAGNLRTKEWRGRILFRMVIVAFVFNAGIQAWQAISLSNGQGEIQQSQASRAKVGDALLDQTSDIKHVVSKIDAATSPQAKADSDRRLAAAIQSIVDRVDCNDRLRWAQVIDQAERADVVPRGIIVVAQCPGPPTGGG